jgi:tetratricopeptide (TPR) repeat protein
MGMIQVSLDDIQALIKEALAEGDASKLEKAENTLLHVLNHEPDSWLALFHLATVMMHKGFNGAACALFQQANTLTKGQLPEILNNIGACYRKENIADKAEQYFIEALKKKDDDPDMYNNIGSLHINNGDPEVAEENFRKALTFDPSHVISHWNLGLALLEQERFGEGFDEYSWGQFSKDRMNKDYHRAVWWDGKPHPGKKLVVYGEQGIGDEIMFAEMLHDIRDRFQGDIIIDCHPRLEQLFKRSFPWATVYPTRKELGYLPWADNEKPDYKVAMGTMGKYVRREVSDFSKQPYLTPKRELVDEYKEWLQLLGPGPYIGLGWVGGHKKTRKDLRAIRLESLIPVMDSVPRGTFVSIQYTPHGREDTQDLYEQTGRRVWHFPEITEAAMWERWDVVSEETGEVYSTFGDKDAAKQYKRAYDEPTKIIHHSGPGYDFDDFAAWVTAIHELGGVIITVNTSAVHLCGALGVRCLTLTPSRPAWRYGLSRRDMVMYSVDSVTQYRQQGNDWQPAINALADALSQLYEEEPCKAQNV